jgi:hypothetical protein
MATLRIGDFRAGEPVELSLKHTNFRHVAGAFGPQAMLRTSLGTLYLDPEPASNIETQMRDLAIAPGEKIRMTRMRKPQGYGWDIQRIEPAPERQLSKTPEAPGGNGHASESDEFPGTSCCITETDESTTSETTAAKATVFEGNLSELPPREASATQDDSRRRPACPPAARSIPAGTAKLMACFMQAIDAVAEAQTYCCRKGLGITFTSEDIRATAITCWISSRDGGAR